MHGTLDEIFLYCKELGEEDYKILLDKLREEENNREYRRNREAWSKVVEALINYIKTYGNIVITDNRDGDGIELSYGNWINSPGLIEVE